MDRHRARRNRYFASSELSRQVSGPFWVAGALDLENSKFSDLPENSLFRQDFGTGDVKDTDFRGRLTLRGTRSAGIRQGRRASGPRRSRAGPGAATGRRRGRGTSGPGYRR